MTRIASQSASALAALLIAAALWTQTLVPAPVQADTTIAATQTA